MLEIPESSILSRQLSETIKGKTVKNVYANKSPHKFAFYNGDPALYQELLKGKKIGTAKPRGGMVEIEAEDIRILLSDGAVAHFFREGEKLPEKHQLHIEFEDGSSLVCSVQMYGGLWVFREGTLDNEYYNAAKDKPSPLERSFDEKYFMKMMEEAKQTMSLKALLATEQRIPGLGNGVLQDILFNAGLNPKDKLKQLTGKEKKELFRSLKATLAEMTEEGGRDTEKDLFGKPGGYKTLMSSKSYKYPCHKCKGEIRKEAYMGGSVYYCQLCQPHKET
ncbi:MAG: Formamidopyrimidine-DNA glycosylase-like protein [Firmicutes bacterium]|nr:Formamidopyrimidine-DNA glycosylase-like protein [Bacillota bacterium]